MAVVPMGGDGLDERFFATIEKVCDHGGEQWWLYIAHCAVCGQDWMIAQEERIYHDHYIKRLAPDDVDAIRQRGEWPTDFLTYEAVLRFGSRRSHACTFLDPRSLSLVATVQDLRRQRPEISIDEIAQLTGIETNHALWLLKPESWLGRVFRPRT